MILPLVAGLALAALPVPTLDGHLAGPGALARDGSDRGGGRSSSSAGGGYSSGGTSSVSGGGGSSSSSSGGSVSSSGGFGGGASGDSGRSYSSTGVSSVSGGNFGVGGGADAAATARTIARSEAGEQRRGLGGLFGDGLFSGAFDGDRERAWAASELAARERYSTAMGIDREAVSGGRESALGAASVRLDDTLTEALVARGWQADEKLEDRGFRNQGERVQGMVEIAKALGYGAHVGALQARFGGPHDGGQVVGDAPELGEKVVEVRSAAVSEGRVEGSGIEVTSPGVSASAAITWDGDWRTADLDLNGDGTVDDADLALARTIETAP